MKTDELIHLLSEDAPVGIRLGSRMWQAVLIGGALSLALLLATVGIRHNFLAMAETARVGFKISETVLLALLALRLAFRIGRPGVRIAPDGFSLLVPAILLAAAIGIELTAVPEPNWRASWLGRNAAFCVVFIPVLSLAPLTGLLMALRQGAPDNPATAGAAAGLAAGALAAAIYALHCPDDSPLFLASWYGIAITLVTVAGWMIGRRMLKW